jgi:hypothetical protein
VRVHAAQARSHGGPVSAEGTPARRVPAVRAILRAPRMQPKLTIGAVNDPAEREADRVADQVMRMPEPGPAHDAPAPPAGVSDGGGGPPTARRACAACAAEQRHDAASPLAVKTLTTDAHVQRLCTDCEQEAQREAPT